jgi:phosphotransferase family enzyme
LSHVPITAPPGRQATHDPALPGLARALDPAAMAELAAERGLVPPGADLAIRHVRYHPGRSAHVTYDAAGPGGATCFYGALTAPGIEPLAGHERDANGREANDGRGANGEQPVLVPELSLVVRRFPHDPVLRRLPEVWTLRPFARRLQNLLGEELGDWKLRRRSAAVVRYKPERRCVFQLDLVARDRSRGRKRRRAFFGQVDGDGTGSRVAAVVSALAERAGAAGPIAVSSPVLTDPALGLVVSAAIAGSPLPIHLMREDAKKIVRRLAGRLADIHRSGVEPPASLSAADRYLAVAAAVESLTAVEEALSLGLGARAAALCDRLAVGAVPSAAVPQGCLHGDFHPGQVIVKGRRSWIVDFDRTASGDPLHDVAAFTAGLLIDEREGRLASHHARRATKAFLHGYVAAWPEAWDPARYAWHVAATLLEASVAPLRQLQAGWPIKVDERLRLAETVVRDGVMLP